MSKRQFDYSLKRVLVNDRRHSYAACARRRHALWQAPYTCIADNFFLSPPRHLRNFVERFLISITCVVTLVAVGLRCCCNDMFLLLQHKVLLLLLYYFFSVVFSHWRTTLHYCAPLAVVVNAVVVAMLILFFLLLCPHYHCCTLCLVKYDTLLRANICNAFRAPLLSVRRSVRRS